MISRSLTTAVTRATSFEARSIGKGDGPDPTSSIETIVRAVE
jgi:hypothetical protein